MTDSAFEDMIATIYEHVLQEMALNDIPDTIETRILFLEGMSEVWDEEDGENQAAWPWIAAVRVELLRLRIQQFTDILN